LTLPSTLNDIIAVGETTLAAQRLNGWSATAMLLTSTLAIRSRAATAFVAYSPGPTNVSDTFDIAVATFFINSSIRRLALHRRSMETELRSSRIHSGASENHKGTPFAPSVQECPSHLRNSIRNAIDQSHLLHSLTFRHISLLLQRSVQFLSHVRNMHCIPVDKLHFIDSLTFHNISRILEHSVQSLTQLPSSVGNAIDHPQFFDLLTFHQISLFKSLM
jgi:hypothetical protein